MRYLVEKRIFIIYTLSHESTDDFAGIIFSKVGVNDPQSHGQSIECKSHDGDNQGEVGNLRNRHLQHAAGCEYQSTGDSHRNQTCQCVFDSNDFI